MFWRFPDPYTYAESGNTKRLIKCLGYKRNYLVRACAAMLLGDHRAPTAVEELGRALGDVSPVVRMVAVRALAKTRNPPAVEFLTRYAESYQAEKTIGGANNHERMKAIVTELEYDESRKLAAQIVEMIRETGRVEPSETSVRAHEDDLQQLLDLVRREEEDDLTRSRALQKLGEAGNPSVIESLLLVLRSEPVDQNIHHDIIATIPRIAGWTRRRLPPAEPLDSGFDPTDALVEAPNAVAQPLVDYYLRRESEALLPPKDQPKDVHYRLTRAVCALGCIGTDTALQHVLRAFDVFVLDEEAYKSLELGIGRSLRRVAAVSNRKKALILQHFMSHIRNYDSAVNLKLRHISKYRPTELVMASTGKTLAETTSLALSIQSRADILMNKELGFKIHSKGTRRRAEESDFITYLTQRFVPDPSAATTSKI